MGLQSRVIGFGIAAVLVLAGVVGGVAFGGTFGQILALVLIGLGLVLATALVFYEVGLSEDRERARDEATRREHERQDVLRNERERERDHGLELERERKDGRVRGRRLGRQRGHRRRPG